VRSGVVEGTESRLGKVQEIDKAWRRAQPKRMGTSVRRIVARVAKVVGGAVTVIVGLLLLDLLVQMVYPAGIETVPVKRAYAVLAANKEYAALPDQVEFTIDGVKAVFHRGSKSYDQLVELLHHGRTEEMFEVAGPRPEFPGTKGCGEMGVSSYGTIWHYRVVRSNVNRNYYWIGLVKLTSPGTTWPILTVDPRFLEFIQANRIQ